MKKAVLMLIVLFVIPNVALAVKPDNPGGGKFDAEAALQAETDARIAADADLQTQIDNIPAGGSGGLKLYDADNQFLGYIMSVSSSGSIYRFSARVYNPSFGGIIDWVQYAEQEVNGEYTIYSDLIPGGFRVFSNEDCTGLSYAWVRYSSPSLAIKQLGQFNSGEYYIATSEVFLIPNVNIKSTLYYGDNCVPTVSPPLKERGQSTNMKS